MPDSMKTFKPLDPLLHSELRLAVMSILISTDSADFVYLRGQLDKLQQAGYIEVTKGFKGKMPQTICHITDQGREAFAAYVEALRSYIPSGKN